MTKDLKDLRFNKKALNRKTIVDHSPSLTSSGKSCIQALVPDSPSSSEVVDNHTKIYPRATSYSSFTVTEDDLSDEPVTPKAGAMNLEPSIKIFDTCLSRTLPVEHQGDGDNDGKEHSQASTLTELLLDAYYPSDEELGDGHEEHSQASTVADFIQDAYDLQDLVGRDAKNATSWFEGGDLSEFLKRHIVNPCDCKGTNQRNRASLHEFLDSHPPELIKGDDHTTSDNTRRPANWDMHLHEDLVLKKVVYHPTLLDDMEGLVDVALGCATLPLDTEECPQSTAASKPKKVAAESGVKGAFFDMTGLPCSKVASTLLFGLSTWEDSILDFTLESGRLDLATPDAYLFTMSSEDVEKEFSDHPQKQAILNQIKSLEVLGRRNALAVYEFKNLKAASVEVMNAIGNLANKSFRWTKCDAFNYCGNRNHERRGRASVTGAKTGLDATETPWRLPHVSSTPPQDATLARTFEELDDPYAGVDFDHYALDPDPEVVNQAPRNAACSSKRSNPSTDASNPGQGGFVSSIDPTFSRPKLSNEDKAEFILQQVWAEAVRNDSSVIVLHGGRLEYIAIRHRSRQTLYLSRLVKANEPGYNKLHTGIMIASYTDALERAKQISETKPPELPIHFTKIYDKGTFEVSEDSDLKNRHLSVKPYEGPMENGHDKWILEQFSQQTAVQLNTGGFTLFSLSEQGAIFGRSQPPPPGISPRSINYRLNHSNLAGLIGSPGALPPLRLNVIDQVRNSGRVFVARLHCPGRGCLLSKNVILKFADTDDEHERLREEHRFYELLKGTPGIVMDLGLFRHQDYNGLNDKLMLVLSFGGDPANRAFSVERWKVIREINKDLISKGFLHQALNQQHIIFNNGAVSFISIGHCLNILPPYELATSVEELELRQREIDYRVGRQEKALEQMRIDHYERNRRHCPEAASGSKRNHDYVDK